jgi:hypothetical protein
MFWCSGIFFFLNTNKKPRSLCGAKYIHKLMKPIYAQRMPRSQNRMAAPLSGFLYM